MSEKFRHKSFWMGIAKGSKVSFTYRGSALGKAPEVNELILDEIRDFDDYEMNSTYVCFQKQPEDLGKRSIAIPVLLEDFISVDAVNGEVIVKEKKIRKIKAKPVKEKVVKQKEPMKKEGKKDPEPIVKAAAIEKPAPVKERKHKYGFEVTEKDGRYFCPCGISFSRKDTAVWRHSKKHLKA